MSITVEKPTEIPVDELSISCFEFPSEEADWTSIDDHPAALEESNVCVRDLWKKDSEIDKPVAPPRRKVASPPKTCLDLTPLTPIVQENEEAGGKEQREEEKETASPAETADEGDGDGEENALAVAKTEAESVQDGNEVTTRDERDGKPTEGENPKPEEGERSQTETVTKQTELETDVKSSETDPTENNAEKQEDSSTVFPTEQAKNKGQCVIL